MNSTATSHSRNPERPSWSSLLAAIVLAIAFIYFWIVPLFRPRGDFLWGHYQLIDIYLGIPIAASMLCFFLIFAVPARYRRSFSLRLVTVVISLLMVFAVCDAGYAFAFMGAWRADYWLDQAHISRRYSSPDPELGFVRKPHVSWQGFVPDVNRIVAYRSDENGFRNAPGQRRAQIVFIGDSYSEAATVSEDDTFIRRVAQATGLSTVNLARGAYGPQQELIALKRYGLAYEPRIVVWQLFEGNDVTDAEQFAGWLNNSQQTTSSLKERYLDNSLLRHWLTRTLLQSRRGPMITLRYDDGTAKRMALRYGYDPEQFALNRLGMVQTLNTIETGHRLCQSRGIQLLLVLVPTMARVMAPHISFDGVEDQMSYLPQPVSSHSNLSAGIRELCDRTGCSFVDAFDAFREAVDKGNRNLYIPNDEHLDIAGHEVMTKIVTTWLRSRDIGQTTMP